MSIYIALVHYPVVDKHGKAVATSITNLDIHDLARAARTYNVRRYYVVNPVPGQQWFAHRVIHHWVAGYGAEYNPTRQQALEIVRVTADLEETAQEILNEDARPLIFVATTARSLPNKISFAELRRRIQNDTENFCIVFGTGWGLHPSLFLDMDYVLEPIEGLGDFNHLSVRSAASIILDRLLSPDISR